MSQICEANRDGNFMSNIPRYSIIQELGNNMDRGVFRNISMWVVKNTMRLITIHYTDRTLDVVFSRFRGFSFTITRNPKKLRVECQDRERERNSFGLLSLGYCERKTSKS